MAINRILNSARKSYKPKSDVQSLTGSTYGGGWSGAGLYGGFAASGLDFNKEAGVRWDNSIVYAILAFAAECAVSVPLIVTRKKEDGSTEQVQDHALTGLLAQPTPWYDGSLLQTGQVFMEGSRGNSYAYKHRSRGGKLIALELLPEGTCYPWTRPGSGDWITEYRVATGTGYYAVPPDDILHIRWATPNPQFLQVGMSPIDAAIAELVADKKATRMESALLNNSGVSPQAIFPKQWPDGVEVELTEAQTDQIASKVERQITGGNVGRPIVFNVPLDVMKLGFDPSQLALKEVHDFSEQRLCAVFGVQPVVIGLGTGLEHSNNRASIEGAIDITFDRFVLPFLRNRARQLTEDLVLELGEPGESITYDEANIPALKARFICELMLETGGPIKTPNEGRAQIGLDPVDGGDTLRNQKQTMGSEDKNAG